MIKSQRGFRDKTRHRRIGTIRVLVVAAAASLGLAACSNGSSASSNGDSVAFVSTDTSVTPSGVTTKDLSKVKIRLLNQIAGAPFYKRVETGMSEAAANLGITDVTMTGPSAVSSSQQVQIVNTWITQGVDVIAVAASDAAAMTPSINRAVKKGILVLTWDADAPDSDRALFVNYWDPVSGPQSVWDSLLKRMPADTEGKVAISTPSLSSKTHMGWVNAIKDYAKTKSPNIEFLPDYVSGGDQPAAAAKAKQILQANKDVVAMLSVDAGGTPANAQAVKELGLQDKVQVGGLSTPSQMKPWVDSGQVPEFVLWDPARAGYLVVELAAKLLKGETVKTGSYPVAPGTDFAVVVKKALFGAGPQAISGEAILFDKSNMGDYAF